MSPFFILSGGNQPSSNPVHLAKGRRSRDYVMFVRNEQMVGLRPVEALVCEGSGLQSHLARLVREKRIPARFVRLSDQEWEAQ